MRLAGLFHGRERLQISALLAGPVGWLVIGYLGSLSILLITSFWSLGELSGDIERTWTTSNFHDVFSNEVYRTVFTTEPPARTTVQAVLPLPGMLVEIEAILALDD